jgi:hypothetical protein
MNLKIENQKSFYQINAAGIKKASFLTPKSTVHTFPATNARACVISTILDLTNPIILTWC